MESKYRTLQLSEPLEVHGSRLTELLLRECGIHELQRAGRGTQGKVEITKNLIAEAAGIPAAVVNEMSVADAHACVNAILAMMPPDLLEKAEQLRAGN
jgi:hypothetical protein